MKSLIPSLAFSLTLAGITPPLFAGLESGDQIQLTIRGVTVSDKQEIDGIYRVGEAGNIRLPLLKNPVQARGLTPDQFARSAEEAYKAAEIYAHPAIEVDTLQGGDKQAPTQVSVGGQVRRAGAIAFHKGMKVIQVLDAVGGRNEFGGRNILLFRDGKQYCLDFNKLEHKNIVLQPGDSLQVEQKGSLIDRWKGSPEAVKPLLE